MAEFVRAVEANIPPLPLDVAKVKAVLIRKYGATARDAHNHAQYARGVAAVKFYHKQATNMTLAEQTEYIANIDAGWFVVEASALNKPSNHRAQRNNLTPYSWAKWVLLNALYPDKVSQHHGWAKDRFGNYVVSDFTARYREHHPCPSRSRPSRDRPRRRSRPLPVPSSSPEMVPMSLAAANPDTTGNQQGPDPNLTLHGAILAAIRNEQEPEDGLTLPESPLSPELTVLVDRRVHQLLAAHSLEVVAGPAIAGLLDPLIDRMVNLRLAAAGINVPQPAVDGPEEDYVPRPF